MHGVGVSVSLRVSPLATPRRLASFLGIWQANVSSPLISTPHDVVLDEAASASAERQFVSRYTLMCNPIAYGTSIMEDTRCSSALINYH